MVIDIVNITPAQAGIIAIISAGAWHLMKELCSFLTVKYFKKIDADYVLVTDCVKQRMNCEALSTVKQSLDEHKEDMSSIKGAIRTILIHSDIPEGPKQQAMDKLA